ncbi:MAG: DUF359 domain-containing protein [Methanobacteriota archaeon]|nr:MAG: DUF359 domain-containing protein [Euryarchaeota archaeon]
MSTVSSRSGFDESFPERDLTLPDDMRAELAKPFGRIVPEEDLGELLHGSPKVISVGDVVTVTLLRMGIEPHVAVFDYRTRRSEHAGSERRIADMKGTLVRVRNPPGTITRALWRAVRDAASCSGRTKIEVAGEEDLATLVAVATAPDGTHVIYGLPNKGLMVVSVEDSTRAVVVDAISRMVR